MNQEEQLPVEDTKIILQFLSKLMDQIVLSNEIHSLTENLSDEHYPIFLDFKLKNQLKENYYSEVIAILDYEYRLNYKYISIYGDKETFNNWIEEDPSRMIRGFVLWKILGK